MNGTGPISSGLRGAMWSCGVLVALLAVAVPLRYGWAWWTVLLALVLLACPVVIAWTALRMGRGGRPFPSLPPAERRKP